MPGARSSIAIGNHDNCRRQFLPGCLTATFHEVAPVILMGRNVFGLGETLRLFTAGLVTMM